MSEFGTTHVSLVHCARCWNNHDDVQFEVMLHPTRDGFTHWGMCPILNQPVFLKLVSDE